jgi:hypothetical protein
MVADAHVLEVGIRAVLNYSPISELTNKSMD